MSIIRVQKNADYFAVSNEPFRDETLSWEARGVLGYLLSKPDNWQVRSNDLVNRGPGGEHKIRRILKELEEAGYLKRERYQKEDGTFYWVSTVYEKSTIPRLSTCGSSSNGKPPDIRSTEERSTELKDSSAPKKGAKENKKSNYVLAMEYLENSFSTATGIKLPDWDNGSVSDKKAWQKRWRSPLKRMWEQIDKDTQAAAAYVKAACMQMRKNDLTVSAPQSIEQVYIDLVSKKNHTKVTDNQDGSFYV